MNHILYCKKNYNGLSPEAALQQAFADEAENAKTPAGPQPYNACQRDMALPTWLCDIAPGRPVRTPTGWQPRKQQQHSQPGGAGMPQKATDAAKARPTQKSLKLAFQPWDTPSAATWPCVAHMAERTLEVLRSKSVQTTHCGELEGVAAALRYSAVQFASGLLVGEFSF